MESNDALALIFSRNTFFKRLHYLALAAFALCIVAIGVLLSLFLYLYRNPTKPVYFATDNVGRLIDIVPVNVPNMTIDDVIAWTINAVQSAYSYNFINYRAQLQGAQRYFTSYGWRNFMEALTASNNLVGVINRKLVGIATVVDKPKILAQGLLGGAYAWKFQMPMLMTYYPPPYDEESKFTNALTIVVTVQRQPPLQGDKGLGILQIIGGIATTEPTAPQTISGGSSG